MPPRQLRPVRQQGVVLFLVLALLLLGGLLVAATWHTAIIDQTVVGHDSDRQRAFALAEAQLRTAEQAIRSHDLAATDGRAKVPRFPTGIESFIGLSEALRARKPSCDAGICVPDSVTPHFWTDAAALQAMKKVSAPGQPGMASGRTWYWVELLAYDTSAALEGGQAEALAPDPATPYIYRVTAIAEGLKPSTRVVLQTTLVLKKSRS